MDLRQRMKNRLVLSCEDVDLTSVSDIEVYLEQDDLFFQYTPEVLSPSTMAITIPLSDAVQLETGTVSMQFAFTDASGLPWASEIIYSTVSELLKEDGYGG